mgnify:CR=1 FL=1
MVFVMSRVNQFLVDNSFPVINQKQAVSNEQKYF